MPRRTLTDEREALQARLAEVEARIAAQEREKLAEFGSAILDVLDKDSDLKSRVMNALDQNVKGKKKRELLGLSNAKRESHDDEPAGAASLLSA